MKRKLYFLLSFHYLLIIVSGCCPQPELVFIEPSKLTCRHWTSAEYFSVDCVLDGEIVKTYNLVSSFNYKQAHATKCRQDEYMLSIQPINLIVKSESDFNDTLPAGSDLKNLFIYNWSWADADTINIFSEFINSYQSETIFYDWIHLLTLGTHVRPTIDSIHDFSVSIIFDNGDTLTNEIKGVEFE